MRKHTPKPVRGHSSGTGRHPLYGIWEQMINRCHCPTADRYKNFGAKGILVQDSWHTYYNFYVWATTYAQYQPGMHLKRRHPRQGFNRQNCYFQNPKNKTSTPPPYGRTISCFGEEKTLTEWSRDPRCVVILQTLAIRLYRCWDVEKAITTPTRSKRKPERTLIS